MKRQTVIAIVIFMFIIWIVGTAFAEASTAQQPIVSTKTSADHKHDQSRGRGPGGVGRPGIGVGRPGIGVGHPGIGVHPYRPGHFVYHPYRPWNRIIYPHPIPILGGPLIYIPIVYSIAQPIPVYTPAPNITPTALSFTFSQCQCIQLTVPYNAYFNVGGRLTASDGTPIPSAVLTEQAFYNGQWYDMQRDTTTDNNGYFTDNWLWTDLWQFPYGSTGDYHFRVIFNGDGPYAPSVSNEIVTAINFSTVS
ncbi:MAG: carboxypeptidase-like regulatory domain-containing protein [Halobacteriota archaeon]